MPARSGTSVASPQTRYQCASSGCSPVLEHDQIIMKVDGSLNNVPSTGSRRRNNCVAESRDNTPAAAATATPHSSYNRYLSRYSEPYSNPDRRQKLTINVSGERYQTYLDTLERFPHTLLGSSRSRDKFYDDVEDEYFFDRDRSAFSAILYYYQSGGQLYCPLTLPLHILVTEAAFFRLGTDALKQVLDIEEEKQVEMPRNKFQRRVWCLFEHPETSTAANVVTILSVIIILLSISTLCIETLPSLRASPRKDSTHTEQQKLERHYVYRYMKQEPSSRNSSKLVSVNGNFNQTNQGNPESSRGLNKTLGYSSEKSLEEGKGKAGKILLRRMISRHRKRRHVVSDDGADVYRHFWPLNQDVTSDNETCSCMCSRVKLDHKGHVIIQGPAPSVVEKTIQAIDWHHIFDMCEVVFVIWFTIEYLARLLSCPNKLEFVKHYLNIIDVLSILPYYVMLGLNKQGGIGLNFRIIRLIRVFRIFKLSRHSKGLQILGWTFRASMRELGLLIFFILMGVVLFSSAIYYVETDTNEFSSIPDAFWWAIVTMCTVGYGDKVPRTFWGKIIGGCCAVSGVLCIALPVPVIVSNFDYFYNRERTSKMHKHVLSQAESQEAKTCDENDESQMLNDDNSNSAHRSASPTSSSATNRSPNTSRNDEIQRQSLIRNLEKRSRKLSLRLSQTSANSPARKNGGIAGIGPIQERESNVITRIVKFFISDICCS